MVFCGIAVLFCGKRKLELAVSEKVTERARLVRRKARCKQKEKLDSMKGQSSYQAGAFGLSKTPESLVAPKTNKKRSKVSKNAVKLPKLRFVDDKDVIIIPCR